MKITEKRLRSIIKSVIKEEDIRNTSVANQGHGLEDEYSAMHKRGEVSNMQYYSDGGQNKYYSGYDFSDQQAEEVREISNMPVGDMQDKAITNWCNTNDLHMGDYFYICKKIGC